MKLEYKYEAIPQCTYEEVEDCRGWKEEVKCEK